MRRSAGGKRRAECCSRGRRSPCFTDFSGAKTVGSSAQLLCPMLAARQRYTCSTPSTRGHVSARGMLPSAMLSILHRMGAGLFDRRMHFLCNVWYRVSRYNGSWGLSPCRSSYLAFVLDSGGFCFGPILDWIDEHFELPRSVYRLKLRHFTCLYST